jgi:hypothetical protein
VDLSKVECRYVFTRFNHTTKSKCDRYPVNGNLQPGQLANESVEDHLTIEVRFTDAPNWEVLVFTLTQVELECQNIQLTIKSYELIEGQYVLRLSVNRLIKTKVLSQRILQLYPEMFERFAAQRQSFLDLLEIKETHDLPIELFSRPPAPPPPLLSSTDRRRRMYQEVVTQIQRIIMSQDPEHCIDSVQRLLKFLNEQNISTEEIQKKVIGKVIIKRAEKDQMFQKQLRQWEETADEVARFSIVGQAVRLAIALIWSNGELP